MDWHRMQWFRQNSQLWQLLKFRLASAGLADASHLGFRHLIWSPIDTFADEIPAVADFDSVESRLTRRSWAGELLLSGVAESGRFVASLSLWRRNGCASMVKWQQSLIALVSPGKMVFETRERKKTTEKRNKQEQKMHTKIG